MQPVNPVAASFLSSIFESAAVFIFFFIVTTISILCKTVVFKVLVYILWVSIWYYKHDR